MLYKHLCLLYICVLHPKVNQNAVVISLVQFPIDSTSVYWLF